MNIGSTVVANIVLFSMFISSLDYGQRGDQQYHKDSGSAIQV